MQSMSNHQTKVIDILKTNDEARGNDIILIFEYYAKHANDSDLQQIFRELLYYKKKEVLYLPNPESIRRIRQKIQADKNYLPSEEVVTARRKREVEMRRWSQT